jgi:hypothetical protein
MRHIYPAIAHRKGPGRREQAKGFFTEADGESRKEKDHGGFEWGAISTPE